MKTHTPEVATGRTYNDFTIAVMLGALLTLIYLLSFSGQFTSIDEYALYVRTENWTQGWGHSYTQLFFTSFHNWVGAFERGQPFMAIPLYWLALALPGASTISGVMLFNVFITGLAAALFYLLLRQLALQHWVSIATTLIYGLATLAWPYARTFFREPLLALIWIGATLACVRFSQKTKALDAILCTLLLSIGITVKAASAVAVPIFLVTFFWDATHRRVSMSWPRVLLFLAATATTVSVGLFLNAAGEARTIPQLADYTWAYPLKDALARAYGAFLSPLKGLFIYSPILLAAMIGWPRMLRKNGFVSFIALGVVLAQVYLYSQLNYWHGGKVVWGPRYYVPLVPFLLLPLAALLSTRKIGWLVWAGLGSGMSFILQLAAASNATSDAVWGAITAYNGETMVGMNDLPWFSWRLMLQSPAIQQALTWSPAKLNLAWIRTLVSGTLAFDKYLGVSLISLAVFEAGLLVYYLAHQPRLTRHYIYVICSVFLVLAGATGLLLRSVRNTHDTVGLPRQVGQDLASTISTNSTSPYAVMYISSDFFTYYWLGLLKGQYTVNWYSPYDTIHFRDSKKRFSYATTTWLVIDQAHMPEDAEVYAARYGTATQMYLYGSRWIGDYELYQFAAPSSMLLIPCTRTWIAGIKLTSLAQDKLQAIPGDVLRFNLGLKATQTLTQNYTLFNHLISADGKVIPGYDSQPQGGGMATSTWKKGQQVLEKRGFHIPADTPPGVYKIVVGWYNPAGIVLAPKAGEGEVFAGSPVVGTVEVLPREVD